MNVVGPGGREQLEEKKSDNVDRQRNVVCCVLERSNGVVLKKTQV